MNCRQFEPLISLYAGHDLDGLDTARVEEHLAGCGECRELLEDLQAGRTALKELGSEAVDAALLAGVRSGVMAGIGRRRRTAWRWVAAFAAAAALAAGVMLTPRKTVPPPPAPVLMAQIPERQAKPPAPPPTRRRRVLKRAPVTNEEPLVVKMLTDDPDIVIIWLVDQRGD